MSSPATVATTVVAARDSVEVFMRRVSIRECLGCDIASAQVHPGARCGAGARLSATGQPDTGCEVDTYDEFRLPDFCVPDPLCQDSKSTGPDSNRRYRITGAESLPLNDQCVGRVKADFVLHIKWDRWG